MALTMATYLFFSFENDYEGWQCPECAVPIRFGVTIFSYKHNDKWRKMCSECKDDFAKHHDVLLQPTRRKSNRITSTVDKVAAVNVTVTNQRRAPESKSKKLSESDYWAIIDSKCPHDQTFSARSCDLCGLVVLLTPAEQDELLGYRMDEMQGVHNGYGGLEARMRADGSYGTTYSELIHEYGPKHAPMSDIRQRRLLLPTLQQLLISGRFVASGRLREGEVVFVGSNCGHRTSDKWSAEFRTALHQIAKVLKLQWD